MKSVDNEFDFYTQNPQNGERVQGYCYLNEDIAIKKILELSGNYNTWKGYSLEQRIGFLKCFSQNLDLQKNEIAQILHQEMGKSFAEALSEVQKSVGAISHLCQMSHQVLKSRDIDGPYAQQKIFFEPLGVLMGIMPWNFPLWQWVRFSTPALLAGNVVLHKGADLTAGVGPWLEKLYEKSATEMKMISCFKNLQVNHATAEKLIPHSLIQGVSFTGSTQGGRRVAEICGKNLKKCVLELGGSDAYLVLEDANLEKAVESCWAGRLLNSGQSCIAAKRWIIVKEVYDVFLETLKKKIDEHKGYRGDMSYILAHKKFQKHLHGQVEKMISFGAKLLYGGAPLGAKDSAEFSLTILELDFTDSSLNSVSVNNTKKSEYPWVNEELFGPVILLMKVRDEAMAIEKANETFYGLGAALFSENRERAFAVAQESLEAGYVVVNDYVRSDARVPFGGIKNSGYGRELGEFGFYEFVNIKVCAVGK